MYKERRNYENKHCIFALLGEDIANRFAKVYFEGDVDSLKQYLVERYVFGVVCL